MGHHRPPSFYHILMNPSSPHLPLPLKFVKKHLRSRILKDPILKSANGGYLWKLKMKKFDDHGFCFVNGWCNVVKDLGLLFGEFLLFKYVGSSVFLMHVYSVNGCEKILVPRNINNFKVVEDDEVSVFEDYDDVVEDEVEVDDDVEEEVVEEDDDDVEYDVEEDEDDLDVELGDDDEEEDGEEEDDVDVDGDDGDPFFVITSSKRNKNKLRFPPDLVAMAKIKTKETITLKNDDGYEKEMPVRSYKQYKSTRYYVAEGWEEFQRSNNVSEGDECVLKFITSEDKLCLAKVTKKKPRATEVDNNDMDDDNGMDEEGEAEDAKEDDSSVNGDDIFDDDLDDEGKGENAKLVNDDEDDDRDVDGDDGDPSFIVTSSDKNQYSLRFSADFVALAGINTKETITLKNLDGYEKELRVRYYSGRSHRRNGWKNYYLAAGWKDFLRSSNISEGDKFVFKFIRSEDNFCVAKITKKKTRARPLPLAAEAPVTEVDDGMDDQDVDDNDDMDDDSNADGDDIFVDDVSDEGKGENGKHVNDDEDNEDDDRDVDDDGDPSFKDMNDNDVMDADENVELFDDGDSSFNDMDDNDVMDADENVELFDDGNPTFVMTITPTYNQMLRMPADFTRLARLDTKKTLTLESFDGYEKEMPLRVQKSCRYYVGSGWKAILQSTSISEGDKCVFKFIASEDKLCIAKIITKKTQARPQLPVAEAQETGFIDDDDVMDDEDVEDYKKDKNEDAELMDDEDPFFVVNITRSHKHMLRIPADFARLARLDTKETLTFKALDGYEKEMPLQVEKCPARYYVGKGWKDILQSTSISEDDKCVFEFIAREDKLCLAKIIKKRTQARPQLPVAEVQEAKFIDDDKLCLAKLIKKKALARPQLPVAEAQEKNFNDDDAEDDEDYRKDENEDAELMDDEDSFFVVNITTSHKCMLRLPPDFVQLAGIDGKKNIIIKCLDGNEIEMVLRPVKQGHLTRYCLSMGWPAFKRSNNISEGDECVFKYIKSEDKMSLAKITKNTTPPTEVDVNDLKVDDGKDVVDDNKEEDENVELVDDGLDGIDVVVDDNKEEDEKVEPVDDGMDGKDVVVDDSKVEDENVEPVDDILDDVVVDDNKEEDENVKPVDDCMDGKDVVVDDNKDEDENVELVDDGMDVDAYDNKDEDENVELVDDGMDVDAYDNKDEDKDVEFVVTITPSHKSRLRLPIDFVASAGIESKENITMKSLDGNETQMSIRTDKQRHHHRHRSKQYHLSVGWPAFKRSNNISEGDQCVFMYTTSEDKMCLAKITKKENVDVDDNTDEDEYIELVDGMDDKDVNEDAELVDDDDPFFRVTITPSHKSMLRLPLDFVGLAGINTKKNIIIKSLDGNESQMAVRSDQRFNSAQYHLAMGWVAFKQRNNLSLGDECVFKYITSEDKLCLAKVTKTSATEADADPFFVVTITPSHRSSLWLPIDFAGLAGIDSKKNITVKNLDGKETQMALRSYPFKKKQRYCFSIGWGPFKRSNNISEGDECVFKYITSEDKMCLAKVTKPAVKRKRGRLPPGAKIKMTAAEILKLRSRRLPPVEITVAESVKRKRQPPPPSSPRVAKDVKSKKGRAAV